MSDTLRSEMAHPLPPNGLRIDDLFWNNYTKLVTEQIIPYQYAILHDRVSDAPPSRCIRNFRIAAGLEKGDFAGFVFQDTDLAKWLEAVAFSLAYAPDPVLEQQADELIALVGQAQEENGYLDTYFTIRHPGRQFCNLKEGHELYTAGHFIEAAVAYYRVTGKDSLLQIMCRCADNICRVFRQPEYLDAVPGHEEIELALYKLADVTGNEDYRAMALEFVDRRGITDFLSRESKMERFVDVWFDRNPYLPLYGQAHAPVRQQDTAEGHAVRALYLYTAVADLAGFYGDESLLQACRRIYDNITQKRMYITGGVGSAGTLERFTTDYDLPNDTAYAESCASIALAMFCRRMAAITGESKYMDTAETALMNTVLAGVSLDGKRFFYVNPLEVVPGACLPATDKHHVQPQRQKWFGCACCPPNIARTLANLGEYIFLADSRDLYVNLFVGGDYQVTLEGREVQLQVATDMPYAGRIRMQLQSGEAMQGNLRVRVPEYAQEPVFIVDGIAVEPTMEKGYAVLPVQGTQWTLEYSFAMPARLVYADSRVAADAGKCAVKKGPLVYCLEEADNGGNLAGLVLSSDVTLTESAELSLPGQACAIVAEGWRLDTGGYDGALYSTVPPRLRAQTLRFVPYCFWGNREPGEMAVWIKYNLYL